MTRWVSVLICVLLGLAMLGCGLLVPAYLRAVDISVIQRAGKNTPDLVETGTDFAKQKNIGAAAMLGQAALRAGLPETPQIDSAIAACAAQHPALATLGTEEPAFSGGFPIETPALIPAKGSTNSCAFTDLVIRSRNRSKAIEFLRASPRLLAYELLRCRELTNTVLFAPSPSSAGQALDASIGICGLLSETGRLSAGLSNAVFRMAWDAGHQNNPQPIEELLLDLMSLGQRFNWGQLTVFVSKIDDPQTLSLLAHQVRNADDRLPILFAATVLSGKPRAVADYLSHYSGPGFNDITSSLRFGAGGINELLERDQRLRISPWRERLITSLPLGGFMNLAVFGSWRMPWLALSWKWFFYLTGGYLMAAALHWIRPSKPETTDTPQIAGFHLAREILFALGFLLVVLLLSEPFLAQETQKMDSPFRLRLPMVGGSVPDGNPGPKSSFMNHLSLLTLLLFFVLQALIYIACLFKLNEIRRQQTSARIKLKLLENEDHLFDAGLYLGFVGTIISLILVSLGVIKPSLMAAYSSTSFGIIFVSIFKIFQLRPVRRQLLIESESNADTKPAQDLKTP